MVETFIKTKTGPKNKNKNTVKNAVYGPNGAIKKNNQILHWAGFGTFINNNNENKNNGVNFALGNSGFALDF